MISRLTLLAMAVTASQAVAFENGGDTNETSRDISTTTKEKHTKTTTIKTTTHNEISTTEATSTSEIISSSQSKDPDTTTTTTTTIISSIAPTTTTTTTTTHASSTHISSIIHEITSNLASSTQTRGTTVTPMLPTLTASNSLSSSTALSEQAASSSSSSSSLSGGAIGGIVAAGFVLIIAGSAFSLVHRRKERRRRRAERNKGDPFTMGFGSDDPKPMEQYEVTHEPYDEEDMYKQQYEPQLSPPPHTSLPVNAAAAASVLASPVPASGVAVPVPSSNVVMPDPVLGAVVPLIAVQDDEEQPIGSYTVIATYTPTLSDELELAAGDQIDLIVEYDDGWCQGVNLSKGNTKGVFPRHCIDYATAPSDHKPNFDAEKSKRVSSMFVM